MNLRFSDVLSRGLERMGRLFAGKKKRPGRQTGMFNWKQRFGASGESLAARRLKKQGAVVLEQNFRCKTGEIDIIAKDGDTLVFVEVKTRRSLCFGSPKQAVTQTKRKRLVRSGLYYLKKTNQSGAKFRFDVVSIVENGTNGDSQMEWIKNAF